MGKKGREGPVKSVKPRARKVASPPLVKSPAIGQVADSALSKQRTGSLQHPLYLPVRQNADFFRTRNNGNIFIPVLLADGILSST